MRRVLQVRKWRRIAVGAAVLTAGALPATANAACSTAGTTQAFKQFGDSAAYSLVPGGSFESSTAGWTLNNAKVTSGNETYKVRAASDSHSLTVQPTGLVVSDKICVDTTR